MPGRHARTAHDGEVVPRRSETRSNSLRRVGHRAGGAAVRETLQPERINGRAVIERMLVAGRDTVAVRAQWPAGTQFAAGEDPWRRQFLVDPEFIKDIAAERAGHSSIGLVPSISTEAVLSFPVLVDEERQVPREARRGILGIGRQVDYVTQRTGRKLPSTILNPETGSHERRFTIAYSFGMDRGEAPNSLERDTPTDDSYARIVGEIQVPESLAFEYERSYQADRHLGRDLAAGLVGIAAPAGQAESLWNSGVPFRPPYEDPLLSSSAWAVSLISSRFMSGANGSAVTTSPLVQNMQLGAA